LTLLSERELSIIRWNNIKNCIVTGVLVLFLLTCAFGAPNEVYPYDSTLSFAPLLYRRSVAGQAYDFNAILSLVKVNKEPEKKLVRFSPLFSSITRRLPGGTEKRADFPWPLLTYDSRRSSDSSTYESRFMLTPIVWWRKKVTPTSFLTVKQILPVYFSSNQGEGRGYVVVFPFFWYGKNARVFIPFYSPRRQDFFGIFPFYGDFRGLWGRDRIRFYLWPLLTVSEKEEMRAIHFPWPFLGMYKDGGLKGAKLWPLAAYVKKPGDFERAFFLWPLGHYRKRFHPVSGEEIAKTILFLPFYAAIDMPHFTLRYYFPVYGKLQGANRVTTSYFFPLFSQTRDLKTGATETRILEFILRWRKGGDRSLFEFFPFYSHDETDAKERSYVLFPLYTNYRDSDDKVEFTRRRLLPFYINKEKTWIDEKETDKQIIFAPFYGTFKERDDSQLFRIFWLFSYSPGGPVERNFAPLWTVFERRVDSTGRIELNALWHLFTYYEDAYRKKWEINPFLLSYKKSREEVAINLLGGILGYEKAHNRHALKLLFIPIKF